MGVAGAGKSTLAFALAERLGWPFQEGDSLHPAGNIAKMAAGRALDDFDRAPWLDAVAGWIETTAARGGGGVVTCSALKRAYRERLTSGAAPVRIVHVAGDRALISGRLAGRRGHFMPPGLLDSQFATLEPPGADEGAIIVDASWPQEDQVEAVLRALGLSARSSGA